MIEEERREMGEESARGWETVGCHSILLRLIAVH